MPFWYTSNKHLSGRMGREWESPTIPFQRR
ncbi:hypothetical protein [Flavonifractor phage Chenonceau]|nr:hypothetical protein [Flavonifractor phage Chenonceau]DAY61286.1 MAG TPA: BPL protein ligase [Caudoviricetes sp.]